MKTYLREVEIADTNREEGIKQGIAIGVELVRFKFIFNMLSDFTDEDISKVVNLPIEEIARIREDKS